MDSKGKPHRAREVIERIELHVVEAQADSVSAKPPPYERRVIRREEPRSGNLEPSLEGITVHS